MPRVFPLAPLLMLLGAAAASADGDRVFGGPLRLRVEVLPGGVARAELGLSVRWDAADIPRLPRRMAGLALDPFGTLERAADETLSGADVGVGSLHVRAGDVIPVRLLLSPLTLLSETLRPPALPSAGGGRRRTAPNRRPWEWKPALEPFERDFQRGVRRALVSSAFDLAVPAHRTAPYAQKEAVADALREAGSTWMEALPGTRRPRP